MYVNIIIALVLLLLTPLLLAKFIALPKNIWLLFIAQPLVMAASPVIVFIGGIVSTQLAQNPKLATLPITLMILGVATTSIPAALIARKYGRKKATLTGFTIALFAAITAMFATIYGHFALFAFASLGFGSSAAFVQQLRFAAIESAPSEKDIPKILSMLMLSGLFAAFLGPEVAVAAKDLIDTPFGFAGSFLVLAGFILLAMVIICFFKNPKPIVSTESGKPRPLLEIIKQPIFIIAILSAAIGYSLMSYLMTATPMSMHSIHGHSLQETKWVIQSHIAAMFLPSLFTTFLIRKFGLKSLLIAGTIIYLLVASVALSGQEVMHYWWALILLGIGWNFLFLTGTTLLPLSYRDSEKHKVQATNDFILFGFQALASLMAGWVLFQAGWHVVVLSSLPFVLILIFVSGYFYHQQDKLLN